MTKTNLAKPLIALSLAALVAFVVPTSANHTQTDSGKTIVFDHKTGNDWWVEVVVGGSSASSVTKVELQQDRAGRWQPLEKKSWGAWAASYDFRFSDAVRFRATFSDDVQTVSCWFTHPAGVERCGIAMPTGAWTVQGVANAETVGVDGSAMADLDRDGRAEVYVLGHGGLVQHRKEGTAWMATKILVPSGGVGWTEALALTVGDADDDGRTDIYSAARTFSGTLSSTRIYKTSWTGSGWVSEEVANVGGFVDGMAVGDVDGDGFDELWITVGLAVGRVDRTSSFWVTEHAASFPEAVFGIAVGDADRDGDDEAWATSGLDDHAALWRIEATAGGYAADQVAFSTAFGARDIAVGDADNDGKVEAYVMNSASADVIQVLRFSYSGAWVERRIDLGPGRPLGLDLADGDGDGKRELYVSDWDGRLIQASWTGSSWTGAAVAQLGSGDFLVEIAIGDAEGDGKPEAYGFRVDPATQPGTCCNPVTMYRFAKQAASGSFDATFTGVRGNEWWQQVSVSAAGGTLSKVDVRLNGGEWKPMTKQSYGWTSSYRAVQGTIIQMRATSTAGATDLSDCYRWIPPSGADAAKVACSGSPPPPPPPGTWYPETFWGMKGNEWWAEVRVDSPVSLVEARADGGEWHALTHRSWGAWAGSFHIEPGSLMQFRAHRTDGAVGYHAQGFPWPDTTPPYPGWGNAGSAFDAAFHNVKGKADFQQVNVYATWNLDGVDIRVYDGAWQPMVRQSWGDWAATLHLEPDDRVQFRARGGGGQDVSQPIAWPPA